MFIKKIIKLYHQKKLERLYKNKAIKSDSTTIYLPGSSIQFSNEQENRIYVYIGKRCLLQCNFIFESKNGIIKIGDNVHIGGAKLISRTSIIIDDDVTMAWGITLYDHDSHSIFWDLRMSDNHQCYEDYIKYGNNIKNKNWKNVNSKPIHICSKVWIGFDVTILKGVTIGEGSVIGAKSVVTKDVPPWTIVAGNPAKVIKTIKSYE